MYFTVLTGSSLVHDDSCRRWLGYDLSENFQIQNDSVFRLWNTGSCFFLRKKLKPKHRTGDQISIQNCFIVICVIITRNTQKSSCSCINCGTPSVKFCVIKCPERVRLSKSTNKRSKKKAHNNGPYIFSKDDYIDRNFGRTPTFGFYHHNILFSSFYSITRTASIQQCAL